MDGAVTRQDLKRNPRQNHRHQRTDDGRVGCDAQCHQQLKTDHRAKDTQQRQKQQIGAGQRMRVELRCEVCCSADGTLRGAGLGRCWHGSLLNGWLKAHRQSLVGPSAEWRELRVASAMNYPRLESGGISLDRDGFVECIRMVRGSNVCQKMGRCLDNMGSLANFVPQMQRSVHASRREPGQLPSSTAVRTFRCTLFTVFPMKMADSMVSSHDNKLSFLYMQV